MPPIKYLVVILLLVISIPALLFLFIPSLLSSEMARNLIEKEISSLLGRKVLLGKPLEIKLGSELSMKIADLTVYNPADMPSGAMLKIGEFSLLAPLFENLRGPYKLKEIILKDTSLNFIRDANAKSNWEFDSSGNNSNQRDSDKAVQPLLLPVIDQIIFDNVDFRLDSGSSWKEFVLHKCNASLNDKTTLKDCNLSIDSQKIDLQLVVDSLGQLINSNKTDIKLILNHLDNSLVADISLKSAADFDTKFTFTGKRLESFGELIKQKLPAFEDYYLSTELNIRDNFNNYNFTSLNLKTETSDLKGDLNLNISPLSIKLKTNSDKLDLSQIGSKFDSNKSAESRQKIDREPQIPYETFAGIHADIDLQARDLITFLGFEFKQAKLAAQLKDSHIIVSDFTAQSLGAEVKASLSARKEELLVKLDGKGFDANPITVLSGGKSLIDGKFNLIADLKASGQQISEIKKTIGGNLSLSTVDAKVKSRTLETVSSGLLGILSPIFGGSDQAKIGCLLFNYELKNGIASSKEQVIKLGEAFIFAKGQLDFPADKINYDFYVNSSNPSLVSIIPPFKASGRIGSPRFMPSLTASVASVMDTTEGVARSALNIVGRGANFLTGAEFKAAEGLEVCRIAYKNEQGMISSRLSRVVE